ncbi:MAG: hypothetical protein GX589_05515 [Deltaproteobacteria bacterium]|nr:hypothetical protein [Deltaproteobacteria bacterium]
MKYWAFSLSCAAALTVFVPPAYAEDSFLSPQARQMEKSIVRLKQGLKPEQAGSETMAVEQSREDPNLPAAGLTLVRGLGLCVGLFLIGAALVRRVRGGGGASRSERLRIIERALLAPKTWLVLAEVDGRQVLAAVSPEGVVFAPERSRPEGVERLTRQVKLKHDEPRQFRTVASKVQNKRVCS